MPSCPETKTNPPASTAWLYGPTGAGALSVQIPSGLKSGPPWCTVLSEDYTYSATKLFRERRNAARPPGRRPMADDFQIGLHALPYPAGGALRPAGTPSRTEPGHLFPIRCVCYVCWRKRHLERRYDMKKDDVYVCGKCGMEVTVSKACDCGDNCATFTCCGEQMRKKEPGKGCCCCG